MLLAVVAAVSLVVGAVSLAAHRTLYEPQNVVGTASRLLDEPPVRAAIAEKLTTRIQVLDPQLRDGTSPEGLQHLAELLTTSPPFRQEFTASVVELQRDLLDGGTPEVVLRLDGMLVALQEGVAAAGGDLGIDEDRLTGVLVVERAQVQAYRRLGDVTEQTGWAAVAIGLLAAGGAVLVAVRRRAAALAVGATTAVAALLALAGLALAKTAAAGEARTATGQEAVEAVWDAVARDVRTGVALVLLLGLGVAVGALAVQAYGGRRLD